MINSNDMADVSIEKENAPMPIKTMIIMETLSTNNKGLGISDISRMTGMSKSTVHRILTALLGIKYVLKDEQTKLYRLGLKLLQLSSTVLDSIELRQIASSEMLSLAYLCRETVHLVWPEGDEGIYIDKIDTPESVGLLSRIGKRFPLYPSASGKAILAFREPTAIEEYLRRVRLEPLTPNTITDPRRLLDELSLIRKNGYALDREENRLGVVCVAAPIFRSKQEIVAAISIAGPIFRFSRARAEELSSVIINTAASISRQLGG